MIEFEAGYQQLCEVFNLFTASFARTSSPWRAFELALRKWTPTIAAEARVRRAVTSLVGHREVEYRRGGGKMVTIIFWAGQGVRFYPSDRSRTIKVRALLNRETARKALDALLSEKINFAVEHSFDLEAAKTWQDAQSGITVMPALSDKALRAMVGQVRSPVKRKRA